MIGLGAVVGAGGLRHVRGGDFGRGRRSRRGCRGGRGRHACTMVTIPPGQTRPLTVEWPADLPVLRQDSATHPGSYVNGILPIRPNVSLDRVKREAARHS